LSDYRKTQKRKEHELNNTIQTQTLSLASIAEKKRISVRQYDINYEKKTFAESKLLSLGNLDTEIESLRFVIGRDEKHVLQLKEEFNAEAFELTCNERNKEIRECDDQLAQLSNEMKVFNQNADLRATLSVKKVESLANDTKVKAL